jgi:drug/metabolite transporter (DMT)-like permease
MIVFFLHYLKERMRKRMVAGIILGLTGTDFFILYGGQLQRHKREYR